MVAAKRLLQASAAGTTGLVLLACAHLMAQQPAAPSTLPRVRMPAAQSVPAAVQAVPLAAGTHPVPSQQIPSQQVMMQVSPIEQLPPVTTPGRDVLLMSAEQAPVSKLPANSDKPSIDLSEKNEPGPAMPRGLRIPADLPGADAPPIKLPAHDSDNPGRRLSAIDTLFPNLPSLPPEIEAQPGPGGRPLTLLDLENQALTNHPLIRQAQADIESARGNAIQVGLHPNPNIGYEADTVGSAATNNYQGGMMNQVVKTAGKLQIARESALYDMRNAVLALRKQRINVITLVQSRYYAVLVAIEGVKITQALASFTDAAYRVQIEQLKGGEAAAYEPMQLRVLAMQARSALVLARNRYYSAWKQLAAAVNSPGMPPMQLAGNLNVPIPVVRFDVLETYMLGRHTDIMVARNIELKARVDLRFEEITPIPDINVYFALQRDFTTPIGGTTFNTQVALPTPLFDRNQGGIIQAQGNLVRARQEEIRVRNDLQVLLADSFERYENNRQILQFYSDRILPDQSRAYRGVYERHQQQPDRVSFGDVVNAQQTLALTVNNYILALASQWIAVTDLLNVMQLEDLTDLQRVPVPGVTQVDGQGLPVLPGAEPLPQIPPQMPPPVPNAGNDVPPSAEPVLEAHRPSALPMLAPPAAPEAAPSPSTPVMAPELLPST